MAYVEISAGVEHVLVGTTGAACTPVIDIRDVLTFKVFDRAPAFPPIHHGDVRMVDDLALCLGRWDHSTSWEEIPA